MFLLPEAIKNVTFSTIEADLTFELDNYADPKNKRTVTFYEREGKGIWVPRFYALQKFPGFSIPVVNLPMNPSLRINGSLLETEKRPQVSVFNACVPSIRDTGGAMVILPCGAGKTNTAIAIALELGLKTAILCHQNFLMNQWRDRLQEFVKGGVKVGRLQQGTANTEGADFVVCSIQSLLSRDYPSECLDFGLVIIDEAHHIAAPSFSRVLRKLNYQYSLGLTATPNRKDKLEEVIYYITGYPCYKLDPPKRPHVQVNMITYSGGTEKIVTYKNGVIGMSTMITTLSKDRRRNKVLLKVIRAMRMGTRKGLLLSDRVDHLRVLHKELGPETSAIICGSVNTDPSPDKKSAPVFNKFITLSTFHQFSEAVDFPGDFIILATPHSRVEQCTGRILRGRNTTTPVIIDMIDPFSVFKYMAIKRGVYYKKCGYEVIHLDYSQI